MPTKRSREFFAGFRSSAIRTGVLAAGWTLTAAAVVSVVVGAVTGDLVLIGGGSLAAFAAWVISALVPEPVPAPRMDVQRRITQLRKLDGHQLPA